MGQALKKYELNETEQQILADFHRLLPELPGNEQMQALRREAISRFEAMGLPTRRYEPFKYSDLRALIRKLPTPVVQGGTPITETDLYDVLGIDLDELNAWRIVVVDGRFAPELSHYQEAGGLTILSLADALQAPPDWFGAEFNQVNPPELDNPVLALNTAFMTDGVVIRLDDGAVLDRPVHMIFVTGDKVPVSVAQRNFILAGEASEATFLESYAYRRSPGAARNCATELVIGKNAQIRHLKYQNEGVDAIHLNTWMVRLEQAADYRAVQLYLGGLVARNQIFAKFNGPDATASISGAMLLWNKQHCDTTLLVDHKEPGCKSRELFKAVIDDEARGIFQGKIIVRQQAQQTDGKQMANALLLSDRAEFDSKPELEIYADDVVCGHGATSGQLDEDLLFYLKARGIPDEQARIMLITAFVGEVLDQIEDEEIRAAFEKISCSWLGCL